MKKLLIRFLKLNHKHEYKNSYVCEICKKKRSDILL